MQIQNS